MSPQSKNLTGQILPPLFLLPLFAMPWDATTLIYWMACGIAALVSMFSLLFGLFRARPSNSSAGCLPAWRANLRALLAAVIFVAAAATAFAVDAAANRYAADLASRLQGICQAQQRCLPAPEGWRREGKFARSDFGHWTFSYLTNADQSEFGLWIHRRHEDEKCIHGGHRVPLGEVISVDCKGEHSDAFR